jgi:hypothetical protein
MPRDGWWRSSGERARRVFGGDDYPSYRAGVEEGFLSRREGREEGGDRGGRGEGEEVERIERHID